MTSKTCSSYLALFLILNILFFALVSARPCRRSKRDGSNPSTPSRGDGRDRSPGDRSGRPGDGYWGDRPGGGRQWGPPGGRWGGPGGGQWGGPGSGFGGGRWDGSTPPRRGGDGSYGSTPSTPPGGSTPLGGSCPREAMKFSVCTNVLNGLFNVTLGVQPATPCCTLLNGLVDLEAASCLCTALKSNVMGTNRNIPISLSVILNACSKQVPRDFQCA